MAALLTRMSTDPPLGLGERGGLGREFRRGPRLGQVGVDEVGGPACGMDLLHHLPAALGVAAGDHDAGAVLSELERGGASDSAGGAGDEGCLDGHGCPCVSGDR